MKGMLEDAYMTSQKAIELNPSNPRGYTNLGLIYYQRGDKGRAKSLWQKALALDPDFPDAQRALRLLDRS